MTSYGRILVTPTVLEHLLRLPDGVHILGAGFHNGQVQLTIAGHQVPGVQLHSYWHDVSLPVVRPTYQDDGTFKGWEKPCP